LGLAARLAPARRTAGLALVAARRLLAGLPLAGLRLGLGLLVPLTPGRLVGCPLGRLLPAGLLALGALRLLLLRAIALYGRPGSVRQGQLGGVVHVVAAGRRVPT